MKKIALYTLGLLILLSTIGYVYLYVLHKGPEITQPEAISNGKNSFVLNAYKVSERKSIRVWTYKPSTWKDGEKILFVMHGAGRNADDYLGAWVEAADKNNILLIAPEFESKFSKYITNDYAEGNLFTFFGTKNPKDEWAFSVIENIFDYIIEINNFSNTSYDIFGHSAGGQFVHRMVLLKPDARINIAIAANSGTYMFLDPNINFPYGSHKVSLDKSGLEKSLKKKLVILLGEMDNTSDQGILDQTELANNQGAHRLERGTNFFKKSERFANENNFEFNWVIDTVENVGHNYKMMSKNAFEHLKN